MTHAKPQWGRFRGLVCIITPSEFENKSRSFKKRSSLQESLPLSQKKSHLSSLPSSTSRLHDISLHRHASTYVSSGSLRVHEEGWSY